jgi:hypothetical protein
MVAGVLQLAVCAAQTPGTQAQRRQEYLELSRQVFAGPGDSDAARQAVNAVLPAQLKAVTERLHGLAVAEIEGVLAGNNPSAQDVALAVRTLLGATSPETWDTQATNTPFAAFVPLNGGRVLAAAYGILRGGGALPNTHWYLEFYAPDNGTWSLRASANPDFDGRTFFVSQMDAGLAGQAWILAWGKTFGDTGARLQLRLYAFDGSEAPAIWQKDGLIRGDVTISGRSVTLGYDKDYHSGEREHETLFVTLSGLK